MTNTYNKLTFRTLSAEEIECRIGMVSEKGLSLLLYKDARCDMNLLDEVVGPMSWQRKHELINGHLHCTVSIYNEATGQWVSKSDVGSESNTEATKGEASDSFKRACFNWGIGRELYTAPFIWIDKSIANIQGKKCSDKFKVKSISYDENRNINSLVIINEKTKAVVYSFGSSARVQVKKQNTTENTTEDVKVPTKSQLDEYSKVLAEVLKIRPAMTEEKFLSYLSDKKKKDINVSTMKSDMDIYKIVMINLNSMLNNK